jgi:hypothetical protein
MVAVIFGFVFVSAMILTILGSKLIKVGFVYLNKNKSYE